jgi:hypothetical protein
MRHLILAGVLALALSCASSVSSQQTTIPSPAILQALEGNYTLKMVSGEDTRYSTAVVKEIAAGQYQVARITVYGPIMYGFTLGADATVRSEELGEGSITYQPQLKKTTIHFEKGGIVCELSR